MKQGTILVFNVDPHLDCQELSRIFSTYGDIKRIQEVPDRKNHKLIEFYDIRCANLAMQAINRALVAGSQNRQENLSEGPSAAQQAANLQAVGSGGSGDLSVRSHTKTFGFHAVGQCQCLSIWGLAAAAQWTAAKT